MSGRSVHDRKRTRLPMYQSKWAILIGNNCVPPINNGPAYNDDSDDEDGIFKGCVSDVEQMSSYLQETFSFSKQNIFKLTYNGSRSERLLANAASIPTYRNVLRVFEDVQERSSPGDVVYIHFSVASSLVPTVLETYRARRSNEQGFVLLGDTWDRKYLHDLELAVLVDRLLKKGLEVSIVLDTRSIAGPREGFRETEFSQADLLSVFHGFSCPENYDNKLSNPDMPTPYVLLWGRYFFAAYDVHEYKEPGSKFHHGFITYGLLRALKNFRGRITWSEIVRQLSIEAAPFRKLDPDNDIGVQSYGSAERLFLQGCDERAQIVPCLNFPGRAISDANGISMRMEGGAAHMVVKGGARVRFVARQNELERFESLSRNWEENAEFEVIQVHELWSSLRLVNSPPGALTDEENTSSEETIVNGTASVLDSHLYGFRPQSTNHHIRLYYDRLNLSTNNQAFQDKIKVLPVGGFRYTSNGDTTNARSPTITPDGCVHLVTGDYATMVFSNASKEPAYMHILYFDNTFGITQFYPTIYQETPTGTTAKPKRLDPKFTFDVRLWLPTASPSEHGTPAKGYIKVFAVNKPTSFHPLELPSIKEEASRPPFDPNALTAGSGTSRVSDSKSLLDAYFNATTCAIEEISFDDKWCSFNIEFAIHANTESLDAVIGRHE